MLAQLRLRSSIYLNSRCFSNIASSLATTNDFSHIMTGESGNNIPLSIAQKVGQNLHLLKNHPIHIIKSIVEKHFDKQYMEYGEPKFSFLDNLSPIVSTESCFDVLLTPKDHISRQPSDTYFLNNSTVLRTHTSVHQSPTMLQGLKAFLVTGDVYRRDEIDSTHYPVFHQMEGVRIFPELNGKYSREEKVKIVQENLKKTIESMILSVFGANIQMRWVDCYFPFTEPSFELEVLFQGKWIEVLGSGVIRQEIMETSEQGETVGWALGFGLERLAMILFDIPDIRLFWSKDPRFINQFKDGEITKFVPYSKYPPCYKDLSFWVNSTFNLNDLYEIVRDVAGDLVEQVLLVDEFQHPKTKQISKCFRINYRSMDRNLTNNEVDEYQRIIRERLVSDLDVNLR